MSNQEQNEENTEDLDLFDPDKLDEEVVPFRYSITSYGADYTIDGLVNRLDKGDIYIPPFQRRYVWKPDQASRFIESLLLGLPVPGVFLAKEEETQKLLVIDGQQRLLTLQMFHNGVFEPTKKEFSLINVQERYLNRTYKTLLEEDRRKFDDSVIHATVVRQDEPSEDESSIHLIFERLNTGGTLLSHQEIRASVSHGPFVKLLHDLNDNADWRTLIGKQSPRLRDEELILRFLALYFEANQYEPPMKKVLNTFLARNRKLDKYSVDQISDVFLLTANAVRSIIGDQAFKPAGRLNAAVVDSVMVGLASRLQADKNIDNDKTVRAYSELIADAEYDEAIRKSTSHAENVKRRLQLAISKFGEI